MLLEKFHFLYTWCFASEVSRMHLMESFCLPLLSYGCEIVAAMVQLTIYIFFSSCWLLADQL